MALYVFVYLLIDCLLLSLALLWRLDWLRLQPSSSPGGGGPTLAATYSGHGSRQNPSTMDNVRGALLALAAGFRLSATQA